MEIKLTNKQKILLEGLARTSIFLVMIKKAQIVILEWIIIPILEVITFFGSAILDSGPSDSDSGDIALALILSFSFVFVCNIYVTAKICGIHKYFSQFKFWKSFLFLLLISYLAYYFSILNLHTFKLNYSASGDAGIACFILPSYLAYLFFNFLTKKFPMPFEKIGYFFSLEFYKNLGLQLWKKLRKIG